MTRSTAREIAIHYIFELGFTKHTAETLLNVSLTPDHFAELAEECELYAEFPNPAQEEYIRKLVTGTFVHGYELDEYIARHAVGWSFARIPRMAAAIMRTAMYEVLYMPEIPNAAAINEALEIAKGYDDPKVISFMNGILGSFVRTEFTDAPPKPEKIEVTEVVEVTEDAEVVAETATQE